MKKAIVETAGELNEYRAKITLIVMAACLVSALFYAINLYSVISKTIAYGHASKQAAALSSDLASLDGEYLRLSSAITPDQMGRYGLEKGQVSMYITRTAATAYAGSLSTGAHGF